MKQHTYTCRVIWEGNLGTGTSSYQAYSRNHTVKAANKPSIAVSSDTAFRGDPERYNPEELFLSAIASCHMLWYLHLCAVRGIVVMEYGDEPEGILEEREDGTGDFSSVILHPKVLISETSDPELAHELHEEANRYCFIANSLKLRVEHRPSIVQHS